MSGHSPASKQQGKRLFYVVHTSNVCRIEIGATARALANKQNHKFKSRVIIRPPTDDDCEAFIAAVRRSRSLHRNWVNPRAATRAGFDKYFKSSAPGQSYRFLVILRATGELVGVINLNNVVRGSFENAAAGYYAFLPHAGKGLMREGMLLVLKHAFQKLKLHRVEANVQPDNRQSIALVKSCGFVREGFSRRVLKVCGRWKDHERWAILAEDFDGKLVGTLKR